MKYAPLFVLLANILSACGTDTPATNNDDDGDADVSCADGSFRSTTGACQTWAVCSPGSRLTGEPSATADRTCTGCVTGTFNTQENSTGCIEWSTCTAGTYVSNTPSATQDRVCTACSVGTNTTSANLSACVRDGCVPGTARQGEACVACVAGNYCAGGETTAVACVMGTWDHDGDTRTICAAHTTCVAGEVVTVEGTSTTDRGCEPCPADEFSAAPNSDSCTPRLICDAGTFAENTPTSSACNVCDAATWDDDGDPETACVARTVCVPGEFVSVEGTPTDEQLCDTCAAETFSAASNASACSGWSTCSAPADYMTATPSDTRDRACAPCPTVTINGRVLATSSTEDNAIACCAYPDPASATIGVNLSQEWGETVRYACGTTSLDGCPLINGLAAADTHILQLNTATTDANCASQYTYRWEVRYPVTIQGGAPWTARGIRGDTTDTLTILPNSLPDVGTSNWRIRVSIANTTTGAVVERRFRFQYTDSTVTINVATTCQSPTPPNSGCPENILPPLP